MPPSPVSLTRTVAVSNRHPRLRVPRAAVARAVAVLDAHAAKFLDGCPPGELSVVFLTDPALARLHTDFMHDPAPTDVITFAGNAPAGLAGEICVSADTAAAYARRHRRSFAAELTLYLVHGWLHLAGYDDLSPAAKRRMRAAEKRALRLLCGQNALPVFQRA